MPLHAPSFWPGSGPTRSRASLGMTPRGRKPDDREACGG
jgi:hypothetical protein